MNWHRASASIFRNLQFPSAKKTADTCKQEVSHHLGVYITEDHGLYLGLPSRVSRSKTDMFDYIVDRVRKKLQSWKNI